LEFPPITPNHIYYINCSPSRDLSRSHLEILSRFHLELHPLNFITGSKHELAGRGTKVEFTT
jgi:hypothetical protein